MEVHAIQTGRLVGNERFFREGRWGTLLRPRVPVEFPAHFFVLDHPEGRIAIDTGLRTGLPVAGWQQRLVPQPRIAPEEEAGPALRAGGIDPDEVRRVLITHLDWDHVGGIAHFPDREVLVHRREHDFAHKPQGRLRYRTGEWPASFRPTLYDLDREPYGPFPRSRRVTEAGDVRLVSLAGHTIGQVGVVVEDGDAVLFFVADHVLRQDWFVEDLRLGRDRGLGIWFPKQAVETTRRIRRFTQERPVVLLPTHDSETPARLVSREPVSL